ncbi:MAG: hypothetical protein HOQ24_03480 [Mycobacteriaceae bacterium]|nr:hypothetical protein [Mycobacteriaceae bacterium]
MDEMPGITLVVQDAAAAARVPDLLALARGHGIEIVGLPRVRRVVETRLPTRFGVFRALGYRDEADGSEHLALVMGDPATTAAAVSVHRECPRGGAFGSRSCRCRARLDAALAAVAAAGHGAVVYLRGGTENTAAGIGADLDITTDFDEMRAWREEGA